MRRTDIIGFILAALLPLVGFLYGVVLTLTTPPGEATNGPWIIITSLFAWVIWLAVLPR